MGLNIPRPTKRPKTPPPRKETSIDAVIGVLTAKEMLNRQTRSSEKEEQEQMRSPLNCPNCCAPIVKEYCEYCGTHFGFAIKMVKLDGFKSKEEIEQIKNAFDNFHKEAYNIGEAPKLPIKRQR